MKKFKLILIFIVLQNVSQNFIPILINKINKDIKIEKILINKKKHILIKNFHYENKKFTIKIKKILINFKIKNIITSKPNKLKIKNLSINYNKKTILINKIKQKILIHKKYIKINISKIKGKEKKLESFGKINFNLNNKKYNKKYTFILNKNIIKAKNKHIKKIKIHTKKISINSLIKKNAKKTLILTNLIYYNIQLNKSIIIIKKNTLKLKIPKLKTLITYTKNVKIKITSKNPFYEIKIKNKNKNITTLIIKEKEKKILIQSNLKYKNYTIKNPEKIKIDKKYINFKNINLINLNKKNYVIIKIKISYNTTLFGTFYIYSINMNIPAIKMLTKTNTSCNIYLKGKIYKSLIYTQNIIQYRI